MYYFILTAISLIFLFKNINCIYIKTSSTDRTSPNLFSILDETQFNYTSIDSRNYQNGFPLAILLQVHLIENYLNITLYASPQMNTQIHTKNGLTTTLSQNKLEYQTYEDKSGLFSAILINNTDLKIQHGIDNIQTPFRILFRTFINGTEVNFQPTLVVDEKSSKIQLKNSFSVISNQNCLSNECLNGGTCVIGIDNQAACVCTDSFTGSKCEITSQNSELSIGKVLKSFQDLDGLRNNIKKQNLNRTKRTANKTQSSQNQTSNNARHFYLEYLVVVDKSTKTFMLNLYPYPIWINDYMNIAFNYIVNQINRRYVLSFSNDPDMRIHVSMASLLVLDNVSDTPWADISLVGAPGFPYYNNNPINLPTCLNDVSIKLFANSMKNLQFNISFDYAVAVMNLDIWLSDQSLIPIIRKAVTGYTSLIGGICSNDTKYSIIELSGFQGVLWAAHELGHSLGAYHDADRNECLATGNNIMTGFVGKYANPANITDYYLTFSACSLSKIKTQIFPTEIANTTSNGLPIAARRISESGKCLLNVPGLLIESQISDNYANLKSLKLSNLSSIYPGQCYTLDQQCQMSFGNMSKYCNGTYSGSKHDQILCQTLYCKVSPLPGICTTGGAGVLGFGALDGSPCSNSINNTIPSVCSKGVCVPKSSLNITVCGVDSCLSNGTSCVVDPFVVSLSIIPKARNFIMDNFLQQVTTTTTAFENIITSTYYFEFSTKWKQYGDNFYFYNFMALVHSEAQEYCNIFDSTLVQLTDLDQLNYLIENVLEINDTVWVGGYSIKSSVFIFEEGGAQLNDSLFCQDGINGGVNKKKKLNQQCVVIPDQEHSCLIDDFCYNSYSSICQWKNGALPTILPTAKFTISTTTPQMTTNQPPKRVITCEKDILNIKCPSEYSIYVFNAFYGRTENGTCGSSWNTNCSYDAAKDLRQLFGGYQSITVNLTSSLVGHDPCPGVSQYAIVDYLCILNSPLKSIISNCDYWMKNSNFKSVDLSLNYCNCSSTNRLITWDKMDECTPVTTTIPFYQGFMTLGLVPTTVIPMNNTESISQYNQIRYRTGKLVTTTLPNNNPGNKCKRK